MTILGGLLLVLTGFITGAVTVVEIMSTKFPDLAKKIKQRLEK